VRICFGKAEAHIDAALDRVSALLGPSRIEHTRWNDG
jgi:hypothetical protein